MSALTSSGDAAFALTSSGDAMSTMTSSSEAVSVLADFVVNHRRLAVLTGAGISTASGIPDYRDEDGVRRGQAPMQGPAFRADEALRRRYWARSMAGWPTLAGAAPNAGHHALAALAAQGRVRAIVTQNVDGLLQRASATQVIELHGSIHAVRCLACSARHARGTIQRALEQLNPTLAGVSALPAPDGDAHLEPDCLRQFRVPPCPHCGGVLQPDVVFFGDGVPRAQAHAADHAVAEADALLVIGSSLMVLSSFRLCRDAAAAGKPIAAVNRGATRADALFALNVAAAAESVLPHLVHALQSR